MSISKEEFKKAADHVGVQGYDRLALWAWWLKAWKFATDFDEAKERDLFEKWTAEHDFLGGIEVDRAISGEYSDQDMQCAWEAWESCAKSRAAR